MPSSRADGGVEFFVGAGLGDLGAAEAGDDLVGEFEFETDEVDAAGAEFEGIEGVGVAQGGGIGGEGVGGVEDRSGWARCRTPSDETQRMVHPYLWRGWAG